jgi:hypothetical protein
MLKRSGKAKRRTLPKIAQAQVKNDRKTITNN